MKYNDIFEMMQDIGLSVEQYDAMINECAKMAEGIIPRDWERIVNDYNLPWQPDSVRRAFTSPFLGGAAIHDYYQYKMKESNSEKSNTVNPDIFKLYELRKEKQKLQDIRTAINKEARERGRLEEDLKYLEAQIATNGQNFYLEYEVKNGNSDRALIICLSDLHLGLNIENGFGIYNTEIAETYLTNYLKKIMNIKNCHGISDCYVLLLGDLISGNIHPTVQLQNRENAIEQTKIAAELLSSFVYQLGKNFNQVVVNGVAGNHSRISFKDHVIRGERLDNIIPWYMKASLSHLKNIEFIDEYNYDDTIAQIDIYGKKYWAVHGDFDQLNESGISKLVMMLGYKPNGLFMGHFHRCEYTEIAGVPLIRSGSFCGAIDDFTIKKRISGIASQMVCVVNGDGIECCYPINLDLN